MSAPTPGRWSPEDILAGLATQRDVESDSIQSPEDQVKHILRDNAPFAAQSIVWLSYYGETEKMRFDAARYILERVIGRTTDAGFKESAEAALERMMQSVLSGTPTGAADN